MALANTALAQDSKDDEIIGSLQDVVGTVLLKQGEESVPVVEGQQVRADQEVLVTEGAKAMLVFNDGCDIALDSEELYSIPGTSPCSTLWWSAPAAAGVACGAAHADDSDNSRTLAAVGLAAGVGLLSAGHNRETDYSEFAAAIEEAEGDVSTAGEALRPGTRLRAGQEIALKDGAKALIRFDDGCTQEIETKDGETFVVPHNSPCFRPGLWWASSAAAAGLCVTAENRRRDIPSP
jgi:hypothetical protein